MSIFQPDGPTQLTDQELLSQISSKLSSEVTITKELKTIPTRVHMLPTKLGSQWGGELDSLVFCNELDQPIFSLFYLPGHSEFNKGLQSTINVTNTGNDYDSYYRTLQQTVRGISWSGGRVEDSSFKTYECMVNGEISTMVISDHEINIEGTRTQKSLSGKLAFIINSNGDTIGTFLIGKDRVQMIGPSLYVNLREYNLALAQDKTLKVDEFVTSNTVGIQPDIALQTFTSPFTRANLGLAQLEA